MRELRESAVERADGGPLRQGQTLLGQLRGIELVDLARTDECCGFGGTFAVAEEAVSCLMGATGSTTTPAPAPRSITGVDMSCLMHLEGLARRERRDAAACSTSPRCCGKARLTR